MYVYMYVCMRVCVCTHVCMYLCMYICMYVCVCTLYPYILLITTLSSNGLVWVRSIPVHTHNEMHILGLLNRHSFIAVVWEGQLSMMFDVVRGKSEI